MKKTNNNYDWYRISLANGDRTIPEPFSTGGGADGSIDPLADNNGRAIVRLHNGSTFVPSYSQLQGFFTRGSAYVPLTGVNITASPTSRLIQIWGHNGSLLTDGFVMLFSSLAPIANGTTPILIMPVKATESFSLSVVPPGIFVIGGISIGFSITDLTFTAAGATSLWAAGIFSI